MLQAPPTSLTPGSLTPDTALDAVLPDAEGPTSAPPRSPRDIPPSHLASYKDALLACGDGSSPTQWRKFQDCLDDIINATSLAVKLPPRDSAVLPNNILASIKDNPTELQRLYRKNRRRAVRLLVEGESPRCSLPRADIKEFFSCSSTSTSIDDSLYDNTVPAPAPVNWTPFTSAEVATRLRACENTAAGPDRITYQHWRSVDPEGDILCTIFNVCLAARRVPDSWRQSSSVLIYKKGDPRLLENWRPIALSATIAKLFTGCIAKRLTQWILSNDVLSHCQKGFLPFDGVFENNFILQQRFLHARRSGKDLCIASLDLANAFGSVSHNAILTALRTAGTRDHLADIIRSLYHEASTCFITNAGLTDPISITSGVRQGCPLSGLLFNLAIHPIIRSIQGQDPRHRVLAYADDLLLMAETPDELQTSLDVACTLSAKIALRFNPEKCFSLHLSGARPTGTR
ncbi:Retrovirus-related Pol polyprotein from type-2 retrotransposable element R2DM, partial [Stegodyphus mimosarum]